MELNQVIFDVLMLLVSFVVAGYVLVLLEKLAQKNSTFWYVKMLLLICVVSLPIIFIEIFNGNFYTTLMAGAGSAYFLFKGEALGRLPEEEEKPS
ncbi:hypothetical protein [Marinomonas sp. PE14-40]|uniref:hypothetical protein n=1 Tax=Marinomonas sp. PE14-40 TaxID=3060621 RepID=UPI003F67D116